VNQLERDLEEHKDNSAKLQHQLDNWQDLKKGDHAELETLRKKKVELEIEVRDVKAEVERLEKVVEKERGRVTKLKDVLRDWKVRFSSDYCAIYSTNSL
jgi:chromosome segregation ATPase